MAPLAIEFSKYPDDFKVTVCVTGQHRDMVKGILDFFGIRIDIDLDVMMTNQTLGVLTARLLKKIEPTLTDLKPDLTIVQGDTTSAFAGALASFYQRIPVAHLEAGLRTHDRFSPFPEEVNRLLISKLADIHLIPTAGSFKNLVREDIREELHVVGNTVIDALLQAQQIVRDNFDDKFARKYHLLDPRKQLVLVTCHRRENFGSPLKRILTALRQLHDELPNVNFVLPVHPNPNVRAHVESALSALPRFSLCEPLDYPELVWLMNRSSIILTDSGGIQEEAPSLGKPVLVLRENTERQEAIDAGTALLVGSDSDTIVRFTKELLARGELFRSMSSAHSPFGDGDAAARTRQVIKNFFLKKTRP